jgi:ABC-2 type transport system permease protein
VRRLLAQVRKELIQILRDKIALTLALALPAVLLFLMGTAISLTVDDLPIVVQNLDGSPASQQLIDAFRASLSFQIEPYPVTENPERALGRGGVRGVLVIPQRFGRDVARRRQTQIQMIVDGADANTAKLVSGYAQEVVSEFDRSLEPASAAPPVEMEIRLWFNPGRDSKKFYGPGVFVLALTIFPTLLAALALAREGEQKTILQVYVSSISAHEYLLGKIVSIMIVFAAEAAILTVFLLTYFGVSFVGDPTPLLVASVLYAFCVASFGALIGVAIPNQLGAIAAVALGGFLLTFIMSGLLFPIENIPAALRWIPNFVWGRYYIEVARDAFLQGGGWPATWYKCAYIAAIGGFFYLLAWRKMRPMQLAD